MSFEASSFSQRIKQQASELGFHLCGICPAVEPTGYHRLLDWLSKGYDGEMSYLAERKHAYQHPDGVLPGTRSIVVLGMPYETAAPVKPQNGFGRIARYAWGDVDYHDRIHKQLKRLKVWILEAAQEAKVRGVVDTAPLLEREFAQLAGIGWIGKNTMLINKHKGSYFFLAALLTDLTLEYDSPHESSHCGKCRACLDACPTQAFPEAGVLDATKCISYLTIEYRGHVDAETSAGVGDWLFGCDVCQEVCPWNRRGTPSDHPGFEPRRDQNPIELSTLFDLDDDAFRQRFRKTPLWRTRRRGILRNAARVLGNQGDASAIEVLRKGINDSEEIVRAACAHALGKIGGTESLTVLNDRLPHESTDHVTSTIQAAIEALQ